MPQTQTSRLLALDDEIEVARPFLSHSKKLDDATLIKGAKTKSQDHLLAISQRDSIGEAVTDIIVERGNKEVVVSVATNPGARFSDFGCSTLATRSYGDAELALRVWLRPDIPRQYLLSLFAKASDEVVKQLEAADRQKVQLYRYMVAQAKHQLQTKIREQSVGLHGSPRTCRITTPVRRAIGKNSFDIRAKWPIRRGNHCFGIHVRFASRAH